ncbi:MAG TPA: small acid-soluble spore protein SspI [Firmicutes bacterium]|jgi:small acid-soluble spore protein I (minor)|nr:small acid-soluble spore protein SspI [Bacillota bacterium]
MNIITFFVHNSFERNDFMNIKDYIIQNFKDDNLETIEKAIDDSVNEYNEDTLPGLGIFFMLVWENSNKEEKNTILEKIKSNLN